MSAAEKETHNNGARRTAHRPTNRKLKQKQTSARTLARLYAGIDAIAAMNRPLGKDEIARHLGYAETTYEQAISRRLTLIPWLKMISERGGIRFEIDHELREICSCRQPRPNLGGISIAAFLRHIRTEISRRKKEEQDTRVKAQWTSERVRFKFAFELLEWIQGELDRALSNLS
jgi:hypothetical protein